MKDDNYSHPLVQKMLRILDSCVSMEPVSKDKFEFHLKDGSIISMTLKTETLGAGSTKH
jgi:hypothetical protein